MRAVMSRWGVILAAGLGLVVLAVAVFTGVGPAMQPRSGAAPSIMAPAPNVDEPTPVSGSETAVLAGGCFWGVQGVYAHVKGVTEAESGYAGGDRATASYETVSTGSTGHAESVRITYDPSQVTYGQLLQIFFSVVQDPTELNRQGPDEGTQYRSAIFPQSEEQAKVAKAYIAQLDSAHAFHAPIVTTIEPGKTFYRAEDHHQDFLAHNPGYPYIVFNDLPKIANLKRVFPALYRPDPMLVGVGRS